jgi:phosphonate degradation associated HDIG domain protein
MVSEESMSMVDIIEHVADIFERRGAEAYLGEDVTMAEHMLQCAALAESEGALDTLIAAALLHDIGYFTADIGFSLQDTHDNHHDAAGAAFLAAHFPPAISEPIRLHVAAKRYLCAQTPDYYTKLSAASKHSLAVQGGPMNETEMADFRNLPYYKEALSVRLWDDAGKEIGLATRPFAAYRPLLERMQRR